MRAGDNMSASRLLPKKNSFGGNVNIAAAAEDSREPLLKHNF